MTNEMRKMVEGTIKLKLQEVQGRGFEDMKVDVFEKNLNVEKEQLELEMKLKESLSKEQYKIFLEYTDKEAELAALHEDYFFNVGVKMGLWDLSFVKEILGDAVIEL